MEASLPACPPYLPAHVMGDGGGVGIDTMGQGWGEGGKAVGHSKQLATAQGIVTHLQLAIMSSYQHSSLWVRHFPELAWKQLPHWLGI